MRKSFWAAAAAVALAAGAAACGKNYEKVEVPAEQQAGVAENSVQAVGSPVITQGQDGAGEAASETAKKTEVSRESPSGETASVPAGSAETEGAASAGETAAVTESSQAVEKSISFEERNETVYAAVAGLNIRRTPGTDGEIAGTAGLGAELRRTGYSEEWSRLEYQGAVCYAATRYLSTKKPVQPETAAAVPSEAAGSVSLNPDWMYAGFSKISSGQAVLYRSQAANRKNRVVCVNAGHGTSGGERVKTQCHPDGTPKVTGGTTGAGATSAAAVSGGMTFSDGTPERRVTLQLALALKEKLLARGYDVLMIRESDDVQLDNVARTVIANNAADCHIALHWDSTTNDKGAFYMSVPDVPSYRSMEPVASHWQEHHALGESLVAGLKGAGVKIFSGGSMAMDLTQTSYSTVPSVDIELGDKVSDHSAAAVEKLAGGLADGVDAFFEN